MGETGGKTTGVKERGVGETRAKERGVGETGAKETGVRTECDGGDRKEELFCSSDRGGEEESEGVCGGFDSYEDRQSLKQGR